VIAAAANSARLLCKSSSNSPPCFVVVSAAAGEHRERLDLPGFRQVDEAGFTQLFVFDELVHDMALGQQIGLQQIHSTGGCWVELLQPPHQLPKLLGISIGQVGDAAKDVAKRGLSVGSGASLPGRPNGSSGSWAGSRSDS
jgi:hypothetical protein